MLASAALHSIRIIVGSGCLSSDFVGEDILKMDHDFLEICFDFPRFGGIGEFQDNIETKGRCKNHLREKQIPTSGYWQLFLSTKKDITT